MGGTQVGVGVGNGVVQVAVESPGISPVAPVTADVGTVAHYKSLKFYL